MLDAAKIKPKKEKKEDRCGNDRKQRACILQCQCKCAEDHSENSAKRAVADELIDVDLAVE